MRIAGLGIADLSPQRARRLARSWRGAAALVVLCLAVYVPGLVTIPPVDRDESRFAQASRQMLGSGTVDGWVVPRVQERARLSKPPLIYWLQAGSAAVLGDRPRQWAWLDGGEENIWVYRLPSVLAAMGTVLMTWRMGVSMFDPRAAWLGAALLAVCPMVVWDAHQARADQVLLAATVGAQWGLWRLWRAGGTAVGGVRGVGGGVGVWAVMFWVCVGLGIMTKGPITPMVAALTCAGLGLVTRRWGWLWRLRPVMGVVIVAAVVGPWVYLVGQRVGWHEYLGTVLHETVGRSAAAREGHWGPPGYHTVLLGVLFWPGSLLTALAIGRAMERGLPIGGGDAPLRSRLGRGLGRAVGRLVKARAGRGAELFCLAWIVPAWVVFELVLTKLPHYTMPMFPAIALLSARAVFAAQAGRLPGVEGAGQRWGDRIWLAVGAALVAALALVGAWYLLGMLGTGIVDVPVVVLLVAVAATVIVGARLLLTARGRMIEGRFVAAQASAIGVSVVLAAVALQFVSPRVMGLSSNAAHSAAFIDPTGQRPLAAVAYHEDSLVFLTRGRVERIDEAGLDEWMKRHPDGLVIAPRALPAFKGITPGEADTEFMGLNYSRGRFEDLMIVDVPRWLQRVELLRGQEILR